MNKSEPAHSFSGLLGVQVVSKQERWATTEIKVSYLRSVGHSQVIK